MIQKGMRVKIKSSGKICDYLHGLDGIIIREKKKVLTKRTYESNYYPVKVGQTIEFLVDLSEHSNRELDTSMSKKFWFEEKHLSEL